MEVNQNQLDLSFEQLIEMSNFELEPKGKEDDNIVITLEEEGEVKTEEKEKVEVKEVVVTDPPKKEDEPEITLEPQKTIYSELVKEKLKTGEWEDAIVTIDDKEVKLSELEEVDEELYQTLLEDDKKYKENLIKDKYVSVENLSETQKTLINIIKNGDLEKAKELFENPEQLQEPFQGYDEDNESHHEQVLAWYYQQQGNSPKEVQALIKIAKEDMTLDLKANKIVEWQKTEFKNKLAEQEKELQEARKQEEENKKVYKKDLVSTFKEQGISETLARKFADVATKPTASGDLEVDTIYDEWMKDPKKAADLLYFMLDKENYLKKATTEVKKEVQKDLLRKVSIVRDTTKTSKKQEEEKTDDSSPLANIEFNV